MKGDYIERIALRTGWFGYWFTILWSAGIGAIGGLTLGAVVGGFASGARYLKAEDDPVAGWSIILFGLLGAIMTGNWCRRRLIILKNQKTEQAAS